VRTAAARLTVAAMAALGLALPVLGALTSCGTDAAAIEACQQIEAARCDAMQACGLSAAAAVACTDFYRDQCVHGVEDPKAAPTTAQIDACVAAVKATGACARAGAASMAACPAAPMSSGADAALTPCDVIGKNAHKLATCAFVVAPAASTGDAGSDAASDAGSDAASDAPTD
jgi:hypothetical protein